MELNNNTIIGNINTSIENNNMFSKINTTDSRIDSISLYNKLSAETLSYDPAQLREIYSGVVNGDLKYGAYKNLQLSDPYLFEQLLSGRNRAMTADELSKYNIFMRVPMGISEAVSSKYNQMKASKMFMMELLTSKVSWGSSDKYNIDIDKALELEMYSAKSSNYSGSNKLYDIEEAVYGFAEILTQIAPALAGAAVAAGAVSVGLPTIASAAGVISTGKLFYDSFMLEGGSSGLNLASNKEAIPLPVIFSSSLTVGLMNAGIELAQFGLISKFGKNLIMPKTLGKISERISKLGLDPITEKSEIFKRWVGSFKKNIVSNIIEKPYVLKPLSFATDYIGFQSAEISQELIQEFTQSFMEGVATGYKDPNYKQIFYKALDDAIKAAPEIATSMGLMYLIPVGGRSGGRLLRTHKESKFIKEKEKLDKFIDDNKNSETLKEDVSSVYKNKGLNKVYVDKDAIKDIDPETAKELLKAMGVDATTEDIETYIKNMLGEPAEIDIESYIELKLNPKYDAFLSKSTNLFKSMPSDEARLAVSDMLNEWADESQSDYIQAKKIMQKEKDSLIKEKVLVLDKNIKQEHNKHIKGAVIDFLALAKSRYTQLGIPFPKIRIFLTETPEIYTISDKKTYNNDIIREQAMQKIFEAEGSATNKTKKGTNKKEEKIIVINVAKESELDDLNTNIPKDINYNIRTAIHELSHALFNLELSKNIKVNGVYDFSKIFVFRKGELKDIIGKKIEELNSVGKKYSADTVTNEIIKDSLEIIKTQFKTLRRATGVKKVFLSAVKKEAEQLYMEETAELQVRLMEELFTILSNREFVDKLLAEGIIVSDRLSTENNINIDTESVITAAYDILKYIGKLTEVFARMTERVYFDKIIKGNNFLKDLTSGYDELVTNDFNIYTKFFDALASYDNNYITNSAFETLLKDFFIPSEIRKFIDTNGIHILTDEFIDNANISNNDKELYKKLIKELKIKSQKDLSEQIMKAIKSKDAARVNQEYIKELNFLVGLKLDNKFYKAMKYITGRDYRINILTGKILSDKNKVNKIAKDNLFSSIKKMEKFTSDNGTNIEEIMKMFNIQKEEKEAFYKFIKRNIDDPFKTDRLIAMRRTKSKYNIKKLKNDEFSKYILSSDVSLNKNSNILFQTFFMDNVTEIIDQEIKIIKDIAKKEKNPITKDYIGKLDVPKGLVVAIKQSFLASNIGNISSDISFYYHQASQHSYNANKALQKIQQIKKDNTEVGTVIKKKLYEDAIENKQRQLGALMFYADSIFLNNRIQVFRDMANEYYNNPESFMKTYSQDVYFYFNKIFIQLGMNKQSNSIPDVRTDSRYKDLSYSDFDNHFNNRISSKFPFDLETMVNAKGIADFTVNEFSRLINYMEDVKLAGSRTMQGIKAERDLEMQTFILDVLTNLSDMSVKRETKNAFMRRVKKFLNSNLKFSTMIKVITNGDVNNSLYRKTIYHELECQRREYNLNDRVENALFQAWNKEDILGDQSFHEYLKQKYDINIQYKDGSVANYNLTKQNIIFLALNYGNLHNREYLKKSHNLSEDTLLNIFSYLTEAELKSIQKTFDIFSNIIQPELFNEQTKIDGTVPKAVDPMPFTVVAMKNKDSVHKVSVELKGGYFPILNKNMDKQDVIGNYEQNITMRSLQGADAMSDITNDKHLQNRMDGIKSGKQLELDDGFNTMMWSIRVMIKDYAWRRYLINSHNALSFPDVKKMLNMKFGEFGATIWEDHLKSIAGTKYKKDFWNETAMWGKKAITMSTLGFSISTMLVQLAGIIPSIYELGLSHTIGAITNLTSGKAKDIMNKSQILLKRGTNLKEISKDFDDFSSTIGATLPEKFRRAAFAHIRYTDTVVAKITFLGAYDKFMSEIYDPTKHTEKDAIKYAEQVILDTQGSGLAFTLSGLQGSNSPITKLYMLFMTFNNAALNAIYLSYTTKQGAKFSKKTLRAIMFYGVLLPLITNLVKLSWIKLLMGDDEDEKDYVINRMALEFGASAAGYFPILGTFAYSFLGDTAYRSMPLDRFYENIRGLTNYTTALLSGRENNFSEQRVFETLSETLGMPFTLPTRRPAQHIVGVYNYMFDPDYKFDDFINKMINNINKND